MGKESNKHYSLLGWILLMASIVTSAIVPSKESDGLQFNGRLLLSTGGDDPTCMPSVVNPDCHYTVTDDGGEGLGSSTTNNFDGGLHSDTGDTGTRTTDAGGDGDAQL